MRPIRIRSVMTWNNKENSSLVCLTPNNFMNSERIANFLGGSFNVTASWESHRIAPLVLCNLVSNGFGPTFIVSGGWVTAEETEDHKKNYESMQQLHKDCLRKNKGLTVQLGDDSEVALVPINYKNSQRPVFWAYTLVRGAIAMISDVITKGQVPLIFDLDETLVCAHSMSSLTSSLAQAEKGSAHYKAIMEEMKLLESFTNKESITIKNKTIGAINEDAVDAEGRQIKRPIIRLDDGRVFTKILPPRKDTTMIIRIRPGWEKMRQFLTGESLPEKKQKYRIFVCTAAEKEYALEVWRLLDTTKELIPPNEIKKRLLCSGRMKKSIFRTMGLGPTEEEGELHPLRQCAGTNIGPLAEGASEMPLAAIIDDRLEVWDSRNQSQIITAKPLSSDKDEFITELTDPTAVVKPKELERITSIFHGSRSDIYYDLIEIMTPYVHNAMNRGISEGEDMEALTTLFRRGITFSHYLYPDLRRHFMNPVLIPSLPPLPIEKSIDINEASEDSVRGPAFSLSRDSLPKSKDTVETEIFVDDKTKLCEGQKVTEEKGHLEAESKRDIEKEIQDKTELKNVTSSEAIVSQSVEIPPLDITVSSPVEIINVISSEGLIQDPKKIKIEKEGQIYKEATCLEMVSDAPYTKELEIGLSSSISVSLSKEMALSDVVSASQADLNKKALNLSQEKQSEPTSIPETMSKSAVSGDLLPLPSHLDINIPPMTLPFSSFLEQERLPVFKAGNTIIPQKVQQPVYPKIQDLSDPAETYKELFEDHQPSAQQSINFPITDPNIIHRPHLRDTDLAFKNTRQAQQQPFLHVERSNIGSAVGTHYPGDLTRQAPNTANPNTLTPHSHFPGLGSREAMHQRFEISQIPFVTSMAQQQQQQPANVHQQQLRRQYAQVVSPPPPPPPLPPRTHQIQQQQVQIHGQIQQEEKFAVLENTENYMYRNPHVHGMSQQDTVLSNIRPALNFPGQQQGQILQNYQESMSGQHQFDVQNFGGSGGGSGDVPPPPPPHPPSHMQFQRENLAMHQGYFQNKRHGGRPPFYPTVHSMHRFDREGNPNYRGGRFPMHHGAEARNFGAGGRKSKSYDPSSGLPRARRDFNYHENKRSASNWNTNQIISNLYSFCKRNLIALNFEVTPVPEGFSANVYLNNVIHFSNAVAPSKQLCKALGAANVLLQVGVITKEEFDSLKASLFQFVQPVNISANVDENESKDKGAANLEVGEIPNNQNMYNVLLSKYPNKVSITEEEIISTVDNKMMWKCEVTLKTAEDEDVIKCEGKGKNKKIARNVAAGKIFEQVMKKNNEKTATAEQQQQEKEKEGSIQERKRSKSPNKRKAETIGLEERFGPNIAGTAVTTATTGGISDISRHAFVKRQKSNYRRPENIYNTNMSVPQLPLHMIRIPRHRDYDRVDPQHLTQRNMSGYLAQLEDELVDVGQEPEEPEEGEIKP